MYVNLLSYASGEKKVMAVLRVKDGTIQIEGDLPKPILEMLDGARKDFAGTGEAFLRTLPEMFTGTYTRAQLIGG